MDETQTRIAESARALRALHMQSQAELGEALGISQRSVSLKLRGDVAWSPGEVEKLAIHFDVTYGQILAGPRAWLRSVVDNDRGGDNVRYPAYGAVCDLDEPAEFPPVGDHDLVAA